MLRRHFLAHAAPGDVALIDVRPCMVIFKHEVSWIHAEIPVVGVPHRENISIHGIVARQEGADITRLVVLEVQDLYGIVLGVLEEHSLSRPGIELVTILLG